ncbi:MAG: N-acetyltransferase [Pseudomonadota bacterium]
MAPNGSLRLRSFGPDQFEPAFLNVVDHVYNGVDTYRAPLRFELKSLLKSGSPYYEHADAQFFIVERDGTPIGRISAQIDTLVQKSMGPGTGQFGYFECENDPDVAAMLFSAAEAWLKQKGMDRALGPFNPSINEEVGLLIEGFDRPNALLMPHGHPYYQTLVEENGYRQAKLLYAYDFNVLPGLPPKFAKMVDWADNNADLSFRFVDRKRFDDDITLALDIFNDAWRDNWGFTPMTPAEAGRFRKSLKLILKHDLGAFAIHKGVPVAFMFVLPDLNALTADFRGRLLPFNWAKLLYRLQKQEFRDVRTALLGTRRSLHNSRLSGILGIWLIEKLRRVVVSKYKAERSELSWILEDNKGINNMLQSIGGKIYKRYAVYEKGLI